MSAMKIAIEEAQSANVANVVMKISYESGIENEMA
jgi:hypothetical protein